MSRLYKTLSPLAKGHYGEGEVELDLERAEERSMVNGGHLEVVPRRYRVVSDRYVGGGDAGQGDEFESAMLQDEEESLVDSGHIERVDETLNQTGYPNQNDLKAVWVDYAVTQDIDHDEAEGMTKAELVELLSESSQ